MKYQETESIELKKTLNDSFEKEVVAFLNTHDGIIYVGIEDNGHVIGVEQVDQKMKEIADILSNAILPNVQEFVMLSAIYDEGKVIIKVEVKKGNRLYYIKKYGRSAKGCYIRVGTSCRSMSEEQIEKTYLSYISVPEKNIRNVAVLRKDFTFVKFKKYLSAKGIHYNEETFLENFNFLTENGNYNLLAELMADDNMISLKVAVFKGKDKSNFLKRNEYGTTCIVYALEQVLNYCEALNETFVDLSVSPRKEKKLFHFEAFKEAWINACVHNKWVEGIPPAIYWYDDRMEIISYGGIPSGLTKKDFLLGKTRPVNKELMDIFLRCDIVEQSGHGVPLIVREYGKKAYTFTDNSIMVTIPFGNSISANVADSVAKNDANNVVNVADSVAKNDANNVANVADSVAKNDANNDANVADSVAKNDANNVANVADNVAESDANIIPVSILTDEELIIEEIKKNNKITRKELALLIGKSKKTVERIIKESDKIVFVGTPRNGSWRIN